MKIEHLNIVAPLNSYVICEGKRATLYREQWEPGDIPLGTDFIYFAKDYQVGVGIPNIITDSDMKTFTQFSTSNPLELRGTGSDIYLTNLNNRTTDTRLQQTVTAERLEAMKGLNNAYIWYFRAYNTRGCGGLASFRNNGGYNYMIRTNNNKVQIHMSSGSDTITMIDGNVIKIKFLYDKCYVTDLDTGISQTLNIGTTRDMGTNMTTFNAGYSSENSLDKLYGMAGIHRETTAEEDEFFRQALHKQSIA